jgi:hypothetical protein
VKQQGQPPTLAACKCGKRLLLAMRTTSYSPSAFVMISSHLRSTSRTGARQIPSPPLPFTFFSAQIKFPQITQPNRGFFGQITTPAARLAKSIADAVEGNDGRSGCPQRGRGRGGAVPTGSAGGSRSAGVGKGQDGVRRNWLRHGLFIRVEGIGAQGSRSSTTKLVAWVDNGVGFIP